MSTPDDDLDDPARLFRSLRDRPTPDLDGAAAWHRLQSRLHEDAATGAPRRWWQPLVPSPVAGLAWAAGLSAVVALGLWAGWPTAAPPEGPVEAPLVLLADEPLVLLADEPLVPQAEPASPLASLDIDVRLVRAYTGATPEDALPETTRGAGAARLLGDIDATLRALVPDRDFAVVGAWDGELAEGAVDAALSSSLRMAFEARRDGTGVRLAGVRLQGAGIAGQTGELVMQPGRVYVLGVEVAGSTEPLLLALRLRERPE